MALGREQFLVGRADLLVREVLGVDRVNGCLASVQRAEAAQVIGVMIRQLGHLFLQPMLDAMWRELAGPDAPGTGKPVLEVRVRSDPSR